MMRKTKKNEQRKAHILTLSVLLKCFLVRLPSSTTAFVSHRPVVITQLPSIIHRSPIAFTSLAASISGNTATDESSTAHDDKQKPPSARLVAVRAILEESQRRRRGKSNTSSSSFSGLPPLDKLESSLSSLAETQQLSVRDRSFARLLVATCVRRMGQIDKVLAQCQTRGTAQSKEQQQQRHNQRPDDLWIQAVLRIGAVQILFLQTPSHAAVKETVDLLRLAPVHIPPAKIKFVNAVLRRLTREGKTMLEQTLVTDNAAPWLVQEWTQAWGTQATLAIIEAAMQESPRCLTVKGSPGTVEHDNKLKLLADEFDECQILPQGSMMILEPPPGKVSGWPLYEEGVWWLQDVSATLPALALRNALPPAPSNEEDDKPVRVVDLCAAPGGKTAQLCSFGYDVTAVEISKRRSRRLQENVDRLGLNCNVIVADGSEWTPDEAFQGVLLDAPCTATGTGSKRPDVLRKDDNYGDLLETQYKLLCHAADNILAPGGILVYATCSLLRQESEDQVDKFLSRDSPVRMETLPFDDGEIPGLEECVDERGWLRVIPGSRPSRSTGLSHVDGFFVARLRRIA